MVDTPTADTGTREPAYFARQSGDGSKPGVGHPRTACTALHHRNVASCFGAITAMRALLTLYLTKHFGLFGDRAASRSWYGGFTALVYLTPSGRRVSRRSVSRIAFRFTVKFGAIMMADRLFHQIVALRRRQDCTTLRDDQRHALRSRRSKPRPGLETRYVVDQGKRLAASRAMFYGTVTLLAPDGGAVTNDRQGIHGFKSDAAAKQADPAVRYDHVWLALSLIIGRQLASSRPNISTMVGQNCIARRRHAAATRRLHDLLYGHQSRVAADRHDPRRPILAETVRMVVRASVSPRIGMLVSYTLIISLDRQGEAQRLWRTAGTAVAQHGPDAVCRSSSARWSR